MINIISLFDIKTICVHILWLFVQFRYPCSNNKNIIQSEDEIENFHFRRRPTSFLCSNDPKRFTWLATEQEAANADGSRYVIDAELYISIGTLGAGMSSSAHHIVHIAYIREIFIWIMQSFNGSHRFILYIFYARFRCDFFFPGPMINRVCCLLFRIIGLQWKWYFLEKSHRIFSFFIAFADFINCNDFLWIFITSLKFNLILRNFPWFYRFSRAYRCPTHIGITSSSSTVTPSSLQPPDSASIAPPRYMPLSDSRWFKSTR